MLKITDPFSYVIFPKEPFLWHRHLWKCFMTEQRQDLHLAGPSAPGVLKNMIPSYCKNQHYQTIIPQYLTFSHTAETPDQPAHKWAASPWTNKLENGLTPILSCVTSSEAWSAHSVSPVLCNNLLCLHSDLPCLYILHDTCDLMLHLN